jgi:hypothetical protein
MSGENVLSLNAFGEIIEPKYKKSDLPKEVPSETPKVVQDLIPLTKVQPREITKSIINVGKTKVEGRNAKGSKQSNCVSRKVLMQMIQIKLLHWQTESLSEHKALDKMFKDLVDLGDELVESVMGKYGRPHLEDSELNFQILNYVEPNIPDGLPGFLHQMDTCFRKKCAPLFSEESDPEIHNIIQEILGKIDKLSYLLTLNK